MTIFMKLDLILFISFLFSLCGCVQKPSLHQLKWELSQINGFPSSERGMEQGVSACYAGILGHKIILAGGCNFPDVPASQGGKKKFYHGIYMADLPSDSVFHWRKVGDIPLPMAYGFSAVHANRLICVGGTDGTCSQSAVWSIRLTEETDGVVVDSLPSLPYTLDNMCGLVVGDRLLVAGGNSDGIPSNDFLSLNLQDVSSGWEVLPSFPGDARIQPVCAAQQVGEGYRFYLFGGFAPAVSGKQPSLSIDGYCYSSETKQWSALAAPSDETGETVSLGGGTGVILQNRWALFTGGVHKDIFLSALRSPAKDYLLHAPEWYRFNDRLFLFDMQQHSWTVLLRSSHLARAGAVLVGDGVNSFYNINGELKPGIRTPEITQISCVEK